MRPKNVRRRRSKSVDSGSEKRGRGRPPVKDPKGKIISLRLSATGTRRLDQLVTRRKTERSGVIRDLIDEEHARVQAGKGAKR